MQIAGKAKMEIKLKAVNAASEYRCSRNMLMLELLTALSIKEKHERQDAIDAIDNETHCALH